jgi:glycosyltransferase involved in cell wall biosynthesis
MVLAESVRPQRELVRGNRIAVFVPCYNEALSIGNVVRDFKAALPSARIYVYDNNSSDGTVDVSRAAGAIVRREAEQGKGNVVRRMFADVDADIYIMVDGDGTYDASVAPLLVDTLVSGPYDMVNVARKHTDHKAYRRGHVFGNQMLTGLVGMFFGVKTSDMLSGYKAFSRRFVKTFPATSQKFETETELMIHCLDLRLPVAEIEAPYGKRAEGSASKLSTFRDGLRILMLLGWLLKHEKPLLFFSTMSMLLAVLSIALGMPIVIEYFATGLVPRLPTALLASAIMLTAVISFFSGLILDTVTHSRREIKRLLYLLEPPVDLS